MLLFGVGKHYIILSASFQKSACLMGLLGSGPRLMGWIGSGVRVSASFQKIPASWVG